MYQVLTRIFNCNLTTIQVPVKISLREQTSEEGNLKGSFSILLSAFYITVRLKQKNAYWIYPLQNKFIQPCFL